MSSAPESSWIRDLSAAAAFPVVVAEVEVLQTHISAVFLGGNIAYKVKKPVDLGFLDFTTLERRRHFCMEEVRLNRRLAPHVYLGVVPIAQTSAGLRFEADGHVVDWAVKMTRLSPDDDLEHRLERAAIDPPQIRSLAQRIATFHRSMPSSDAIAAQARWNVVAENVLANIAAAQNHVGQTVSAPVLDRLTRLTTQALDRLRPLIERRAAAGVPRDTHGDLRVDHVYHFPDSPPPNDWCILDCIEFNERFRFADPVADSAFLVMDLAFHGRWDLARSFADEYLRAANDAEGRALLPLYASYRAAVRGKVEAILQDETEVPNAERTAALQRSKAHWLASLCWLESAPTRPQIVMIGGLPGSGKTTLAQNLARRIGAELVRSDVVRKELAGVTVAASQAAPFGEGIYTEAWNQKTIAELERRVEKILWTGAPAIVDASFRRDTDRRRMESCARRWGVPIVFFHCVVAAEVAQTRLANRHGDASDATASIYADVARLWEPLSPHIDRVTHRIDTNVEVAIVMEEAIKKLAEAV